MYRQIIDKISQYISLDNEDIELIQTSFHYKKVEKNTSIIEPNKKTPYAFFINSGYSRYFKVLDSGEELIIHLYTPGNFATSLNSFFLDMKAEEELQAITDCEILYISKTELEELYSHSPKWERFGRKLMEVFLIEKEEKIIELLSLTAQEKYSKLLKANPDIIQNVPVKYIASFIGIQPESLSRIKKQIN